MTTPIHILRYGTVGDKVHLEKAAKTFDYLAINGNSAAYVSGAIAKFIVEKFFNNEQQGYFVDPITYAFQGNDNIKLLKNKKLKIKKSICKLLERYDSPATNVLDDKPIKTSDLSDNENLQGFCQRVLKFQYNVIQDYIKEKDMAKYLVFGKQNKSLEKLTQLHPKFLIAPYFYLDIWDSDFSEWLEINQRCIAAAKQQASQYENLPIFAQIVLSKESLLDPSATKEIIKEYSQCDCDGFTIWIDDFNEHESDLKSLKSFTNLLKGIKGIKGIHDRPIFNMYGGFFSILLTHKSIDLLNGVSHGLEYGESRAVYPVGGGIPTSKYYFMPLHKRNDFTKAFSLLKYKNIINTTLPDWGPTEKYYEEICNCRQCRKIMRKGMLGFFQFESDQFYPVKTKNGIIRRKKASAQTKENCLYHYLLCKQKEFSMVKMNKKKKISNILSDLTTAKAKYENCTFLEDHELDYLSNWINAIHSIIPGNNHND